MNRPYPVRTYTDGACAAVPPPEPTITSVKSVGAGLEISWSPVPGASSYNAFRGTLAALRLPVPMRYDHGAVAGGCAIVGLAFTEVGSSHDGVGHYWLVRARTPSEESSLGADSVGAPYPSAQPDCP